MGSPTSRPGLQSPAPAYRSSGRAASSMKPFRARPGLGLQARPCITNWVWDMAAVRTGASGYHRTRRLPVYCPSMTESESRMGGPGACGDLAVVKHYAQ